MILGKKTGRKSRRGGQSEDMEIEEDEMSPISEEMTTTAIRGGMKGRRRTLRGGKSRRRRGGQSAATYEMNTLGDSNTQWNNTFNNSKTMFDNTGNSLHSADLSQSVTRATPDSTLGNIMQGGKRKQKRSRKGGSLMSIIGQAIVPFTLLGLQQGFGKRKNGGRKTRRHSRRLIL